MFDRWTSEIEPQLADFVSPTFEELCRHYTRIRHGAKAPRIGGWWCPALNKHRRAKNVIWVDRPTDRPR